MAHSSSGPERLIIVIHEHWVRYIRLAFVYVLLLMVSFLFFYLSGLAAYHYEILSESLFVLALLLFFLDHHWFFMAALSQAENHVMVTTDRVIWIRHRLFFQEEMMEYAFDKMKTVEAHKTNILQYILQYGTLKFESGPPVLYVPHPNNVVRKIEQAMGMA